MVLLSGGLDSATCLAIARNQGYKTYCLSFDYGQRHRIELERAQQTANALSADNHVTVNIDLRAFGGSALTSDIEVPKDRDPASIAEGIPITYVPARNTVFLSFGLAYAEVLGAHDLFIGVNALDYSGYPDCRPEFVQAFQDLAQLATKAGVMGERFAIHAPLIKLSKAEIILWGSELGVNYGLTSSCYDPSETGAPCRRCDSCQLREKGFLEAGLSDPLLSS